MSKTAKLSVVLPVRDGQNRIADRVEQVVEALAELTRDATEVIVVDDGSRDETPSVLEQLRLRLPQLRVARHDRPRGMEASGQTGLERATGELVFIQEADTALRVEDLRRLFRMSDDGSVVAARAESTPRPLTGPLLRRLRAWGTDADRQVELRGEVVQRSSLQMIRRPHLQRLAGPDGDRFQLQADTKFSTTLETVPAAAL